MPERTTWRRRWRVAQRRVGGMRRKVGHLALHTVLGWEGHETALNASEFAWREEEQEEQQRRRGQEQRHHPQEEGEEV